jgi:hypothetical protein
LIEKGDPLGLKSSPYALIISMVWIVVLPTI